MRSVVIELGSPCIAMHRMMSVELDSPNTSDELNELNTRTSDAYLVSTPLPLVRDNVIKTMNSIWGENIPMSEYNMQITAAYVDSIWMGIRSFYTPNDMRGIVGLGNVFQDSIIILDSF